MRRGGSPSHNAGGGSITEKLGPQAHQGHMAAIKTTNKTRLQPRIQCLAILSILSRPPRGYPSAFFETLAGTHMHRSALIFHPVTRVREEVFMGLGRTGLFWLLGVPIPIIILLLLFWR
jgi:hypothetical protein